MRQAGKPSVSIHFNPKDNIMLQGFGILNFRSFSEVPTLLFPLTKLNVIAGRNNTGKSNVLRAMDPLMRAMRGQPSGFGELDKNITTPNKSPSLLLPINIASGPVQANIAAMMPPGTTLHATDSLFRFAIRILEKFPIHDAGCAWVEIGPGRNNVASALPPAWEPILAALRLDDAHSNQTDREFNALWHSITGQSGGGLEQHWVPETIRKLSELAVVTPMAVHTIGAHRQIGIAGTTHQGLDGQGLRSKLLTLQAPNYEGRTDRLVEFEKINTFLREVIERGDAKLEVSHDASELLVTMGNVTLPIESLGTGVHQVIIFAVAATVTNNAIVCIEEPEVHLHPRLQRQLLKYLQTQTSNQYFITTHSAAILDFKDASVFHVEMDAENRTLLTRIAVDSQRATLSFDLGFKASDLVQANAVIWVEGPSDRIYLNAWLSKAAPDLLEGVHYSIMFYGGRLLAHLSADDATVEKFISLQRINRHVAILIDSDRRRAGDAINATKQRVMDEVEKGHGFAWVTEGREVENYVHLATLAAAMAKVHPNAKLAQKITKYSDCYRRTDGKSVDKIALARAAAEDVGLDQLDLQKQVDRLVVFLRASNR